MNEQNQSPALFDPSQGQAIAERNDAAAVARATQEIQAALVIAKRYERNEIKVKAKILAACQRKELAEAAEYEYNRGGTRITGPTIDLLRAIANRWGNLRYGWSEVDRRVTEDGVGISSVRCFAWDLENNGQAERTFSVKHWRDTSGGGYKLEDERDIYEMLANSASRRVRACLEEVIDSDIVTAAVDQCRLTMRGQSKEPLSDRAVQMVQAFTEFGVTQAMIETRLGNKLDAVSENQLASLRRVFKSLKDGVGTREDHFKQTETSPSFAQQDQAAAMGEKLAGLKPGQGNVYPAGNDGDLAPQPAAKPRAAKPKPQPPAAEAPAPEPAPKRSGFNPDKALTNLLLMSNISEGQLLDFVSASGISDGSASTVNDLPHDIKQKLCNEWPKVSVEIKALAAKG